MGNYRELWPAYAEWKTSRTSLAGVTYVVTTPMHYIGVLVQQAEQLVHAIRIIRPKNLDGTSDPNLADFESSVLGSAVVKTSIDGAISAEVS